MAAIDFPLLAQRALVLAWDLADTALSAATLKFRPSNDYNATTGVNAVTWGATINGKKVFKWDDKLTKGSRQTSAAGGAQSRTTATKILVRKMDIGSEVPAPNMIVTIAGEDWKVGDISTPPTETFFILTVRK